MSAAPSGARALRELIRDQATRLFATRGFAGTSIREVAEACGCTKPALYYYFPSKEALFREVVEYHTQSMNELISSTVDSEGSVRDRLHAALESMLDYSEPRPHVMRLMQRIEICSEDTAPSIDLCAARATHLQMLAKLMHLGIDSGELRSGLTPHEGALLFAGALHFQFEEAVATEKWDRARMHRTIDLILDGIAA